MCLHLQVLKDCFEKKDIAMLQDAVSALPKEEAAYHIKRCVDSGLWVPGGGNNEAGGGGKDEEATAEGEAPGDECVAEAKESVAEAQEEVYTELELD